MSEIKLYKKSPAARAESFSEATAEELRVLVVLMEAEGEALTYKEIAARASVSAARAKSATALWRADGVLDKEPVKSAEKEPAATASAVKETAGRAKNNAAEDNYTNNVINNTISAINNNEDNLKDEFAERFSSDMYEERSVETARTIRDGELSQLLDECAALLDKPALSTEEVKRITSIYSQLSLSAEYIFTLAAYLAESGKFTATNLAKKAESLAEKGIDSLEALCVYIEEAKSENGTDKEFRRLFGIWNRKLSRTDREYFRRWSEDFGYSTEIVGEAYGIMTANNASGGVSLKYIDTILTHWHEAGCKTVAQCRAEEERSRAERGEKNTAKGGRKKPDAKPKFVDFDVEDAFQRALERSYGKGENDN